jgi:hypothetical protein
LQLARDKYAESSFGSGGDSGGYSFKSLPFNQDDEESGIKLVPDSYLDDMEEDDYDEYNNGGRRDSECEGRVSVLTIDELKNMKKSKKNED